MKAHGTVIDVRFVKKSFSFSSIMGMELERDNVSNFKVHLIPAQTEIIN